MRLYSRREKIEELVLNNKMSHRWKQEKTQELLFIPADA